MRQPRRSTTRRSCENDSRASGRKDVSRSFSHLSDKRAFAGSGGRKTSRRYAGSGLNRRFMCAAWLELDSRFGRVRSSPGLAGSNDSAVSEEGLFVCLHQSHSAGARGAGRSRTKVRANPPRAVYPKQATRAPPPGPQHTAANRARGKYGSMMTT